MRVVTSREMKALEERTFSSLGVPSRAVMEVAGRAVAHVVCEHFPHALSGKVLAAAGPGNNGGDAFVAARALRNRGVNVSVLCAVPFESLHGDAKAAANAWQKSGGETRVLTSDFETALRDVTLVLDGLFGTGFRGELSGDIGIFVQRLNSERARPVVSIDIPSGVNGDTGEVKGEAVRAALTVALQYLKPGHLLFPGTEWCGKVVVADIGIDSHDEPGLRLLTDEYVARFVGKRLSLPQDAHKGTKGHVVVFGGGAGHYGAPLLAGEAALCAGAGLVTVALPGKGAKCIAGNVPELMTLALPDDGEGNVGTGSRALIERFLAKVPNRTAIVVGPGLGTGKGAAELLRSLFELNFPIPMVLDADALNLLALDAELMNRVPPDSVLTPHPAEMGRLLGISTEEVQRDRLAAAARISTTRRVWGVLKGARTVIAGPSNEQFINPACAPALATAGSGDVLSGVIGALLARGIEPRLSAMAGVYCHGCAGDYLQKHLPGATARDILRRVPFALRKVEEFSSPEPSFFPLVTHLFG